MAGGALSSFGVAINVTDLDRSASFYIDALGMTELTRHQASGMLEVILQWERSGGPNLILVKSEGEQAEPEKGNALSRLFAFVLDVEATRQRLVDAGVEISSVLDPAPGVRIVLGTDPDGHPIEIIEAGSQASAESYQESAR